MRRLTIERTAVAIVFVLLFALAARLPLDTDIWWHLRSAEYTLDNGIIRFDPFSHTMTGERWTNHSWGSQFVIYAFWLAAGNVGLTLFMATFATAGMAFVYLSAPGNTYIRLAGVILGAATAAVFWSPRPQMLSFFLSTVVVYILYLYKYRGVDRLWLLPVVMGVWGNLHAGYSIGYIIIFGTLVGEAVNAFFGVTDNTVGWRGVRRLAIFAAISVIVLPINPHGYRIMLVPFETASIGPLREFIQEWNSPNFHQRETWAFVILLAMTFGAAGASKLRLDWTDFFMVMGTAFLALYAGRNIAVFAVIATPVMVRHLDVLIAERGWLKPPLKRVSLAQARLNTGLIAVTVIVAVLKIALIFEPETFTEAREAALPVAAADYIAAERPPGQMFNSYNWGGYLMFRLPDYPVFVDGRSDLYGEFLNVWRNTAVGADGWRETLDEYDVNLVVVESGSGLALNLREEPGWELAFSADDGDEPLQPVVFVREGIDGDTGE